MESKTTNDIKFYIAKKKVDKLKGFYIHLGAYIVIFCLLIYNYIILEESEYMSSIVWVNILIMAIWGLAISVQAWTTFKGPIFFGKKWEEQKIKKYLEEEHQMWE